MEAAQSDLWQLTGSVAHLMLPKLSLEFNAERPRDGLTSITALGRAWPLARLLGIAGPIHSAGCTLADWHVRGNDVIAAYETGEPAEARIDLLWHVVQPKSPPPWIARIELLVSIRTDRLDWRHDVSLVSTIPTVTECSEFTPACSWFAGNDWDWSLALMVHLADLRRRESIAAPGLLGARQVCDRLFPAESLEKGVILRARAMALFLDAGADVAEVAQCMREFDAADPPLGI
jgi:hypothetical protein